MAGTFLQGTRPTCALRGHLAPNRLLCDLLDAHELVLSAARAAMAKAQPPAVPRSAAAYSSPTAASSVALRDTIITRVARRIAFVTDMGATAILGK
jgi:hypothetical protein